MPAEPAASAAAWPPQRSWQRSGRAAALDGRGEGRAVGVGEHGLRVEEVDGARLRRTQTLQPTPPCRILVVAARLQIVRALLQVFSELVRKGYNTYRRGSQDRRSVRGRHWQMLCLIK